MSSGLSRRARRPPAGLSVRYRPSRQSAARAPSGRPRLRRPAGRPRAGGYPPCARVAARYAVRGHGLQPLGGAEIVGELDAFGFLSGHDGRAPFAALPHELPQSADELGIFGELLHQDPARALERRGSVRDALLRIDIGGRRRFGHELRILQQGARQRLEPGLPGDLRPRAPLRLVGQIQIFEPRLRVGGVERRGQLRRELPLRRDAFDDRGAPILELAQVGQPLGECRAAACRRARRLLPCGSGR